MWKCWPIYLPLFLCDIFPYMQTARKMYGRIVQIERACTEVTNAMGNTVHRMHKMNLVKIQVNLEISHFTSQCSVCKTRDIGCISIPIQIYPILNVCVSSFIIWVIHSLLGRDSFFSFRSCYLPVPFSTLQHKRKMAIAIWHSLQFVCTYASSINEWDEVEKKASWEKKCTTERNAKRLQNWIVFEFPCYFSTIL